MLSKILKFNIITIRSSLHKRTTVSAKEPPDNQYDTSDKSQKKSTGFWWKQISDHKYLTLSGICILGLGYAIRCMGVPEKDENGNIIEDEYTSKNPIVAYPLRTMHLLNVFNQTIQDPISEKLLPDPHPLHHPMTLVIEINGILLKSEWDFKSGWRFKKRPGLDLFLDAVSPFFEIVIFTNETSLQLHPVLQQLDPNMEKLHYRLYREATRYRSGVHIKDLNNLNRNLNKVIRIDWDKDACQLQPSNTLLLKKWNGDMTDRDLVDLAAFLRMLASNNLDDVRTGLEYYSQFDDPLAEFRIRCASLQEHLRKKEEIRKSTKDNLKDIMSKIKK